jgi:hypothetical protein
MSRVGPHLDNNCEHGWEEAPSSFKFPESYCSLQIYNYGQFNVSFCFWKCSFSSSDSEVTGFGLDGRGSIPGKDFSTLSSDRLWTRPVLLWYWKLRQRDGTDKGDSHQKLQIILCLHGKMRTS